MARGWSKQRSATSLPDSGRLCNLYPAMSKLLVNLLVAIVSVLCVWLAVEILLRSGVLPSHEFRSTAVREIPRTRPDMPNFRSRSYNLTRPAEGFRILAVGDSFTWGHGVLPEDAWPDRLQMRLDHLAGHGRFEVINWSRAGWNTVMEYRSLREILPRLAVDLVVLAFVLNDPEPTDPAEIERLRDRLAPPEHPGVWRWLIDRSRLAALVETRLENTRLRRELTRYYHELYEVGGWKQCKAALRRLDKLVEAEGVPLVLVIFPIFDHQLDESYPYAELHRLITDTAERLDIRYLDLLSAYRQIDGRRLAVEPFSDAHPNELAQRLAAEAILHYLRRQGLVPLRSRPSSSPVALPQAEDAADS